MRTGGSNPSLSATHKFNYVPQHPFVAYQNVGSTYLASVDTSLPSLPAVKMISAGGNSTCGIKDDKTVVCWGEFGSQDSSTRGEVVTITGLSNVDNVSIGYSHGCALISGGSVKCWGANADSQLGTGSSGGSSTSAVNVSGISNAVQVSAGYRHTCAVLDDNSIKCWGYNNGQLGNGSTTTSSSAVNVSGISNAVQVSAGYTHTCVVLSDTSIKCWGRNSDYQLGRGTSTTDQNAPVQVQISGSTSTGWKQVFVGASNTCAMNTSNRVYCWGDNPYGQLGTGNTGDITNVGTEISGYYGFLKISTSNSWSFGYGACGIEKDNRKLYCWGSNYRGKLGIGNSVVHEINGNVYYRINSPEEVIIYANSNTKARIKDIASGSGHTCAMTEDNRTFCWGEGNAGQLGDGNYSFSSTTTSNDRIKPNQVCSL